jgi:hypothetical protein
MKKIVLIVLLCLSWKAFSQVNELTFNHQRINFAAAPRSTLSPMSIKMWDNYQNGGPSTYGTVLEFCGFGNHQTGQLYFGGWDNSKIRYREAFYGQTTWSDWITLLDSKNDVESSGSLRLTGGGIHYIKNGFFGLGTSDPQCNFHIEGSTNGELNFLIKNTYGSGARTYLTSMPGKSLIQTDRDFAISTNGGGWSDKFYLTNDGNVGIGTIVPGSYRLNVNGKIRANEIVVNTTGADFVFEPTYKLRSLAELEAFIKKYKHLPDIAPAKEMQENGISAGEMQAKLLQKVEELTIYLIEQNKRIVELEKQLGELKSLNNEQ